MENRVSRAPQSRSTYALYSIANSKNRSLAIDWLSGLVGGFTSATICAPMDLARTRHMLLATTKSEGRINYNGFLQTMSRVWREEGIRGMFKGYSVTAVSVPIFHSLYFSLFYKAKETLKSTETFRDSEILRNIMASFFVGIISNTVTNPLWVIRTRIQSQYLHQDNTPKYTGLYSGLKRISREEGPRALFKGLGASYFGISHAVILYPLYEYLKSQIKEYKGTLNNSDIFMASIISKFTAMVLTYPHCLLRTRLQDHRGGTRTNATEKATIRSVIQETYRREGIKGFYAGLRIDLVRVLPSNAIMFVTFEFVKKQLEMQLAKYELDL